jgi:hypothetical protein
MKGLRKVIGAFLCGIFSLAMLNWLLLEEVGAG